MTKNTIELKNFVPMLYFVFNSGILDIDKAKWVQLNDKTEQVLKNSLNRGTSLILKHISYMNKPKTLIF